MTLKQLSDRLGSQGGLSSRWRTHRADALRLFSLFAAQFPGADSRDACLGFVPGRIEVFGRHTDYAGGRSLVCAIDHGFLFLAALNGTNLVRMHEASAEFSPLAFRLDASLTPPMGSWGNYPMTMARRLARNFGGRTALRGIDVVFSSTMPVGSGMSGSSALMMMTFTAIARLNNLHESALFRESLKGPTDLTVYLACAENGQSFKALTGDRGVGTFGGSEDHAAILNGRASRLSLFSFAPASLIDEVSWPGDWRMVVAFSGVRAEKTRESLEKYNLASRRAREALESYNRMHDTRLATLKEAVDHAADHAGAGWWKSLDSAGLAPSLGDRVHQFILEDRRHIPGAVDALREKDMRSFGELLTASHKASGKFLWNIAPEIDFLQRSAVALGAAGASGFGAGFGGSIFAVVAASRARTFLAEWREGYVRRHPARAAEASFFSARPASGIEVWEAGGPVRLVDMIYPR